MQDEQLDNIINEAANQHHPPYNDTAWDKMQAKLDVHLPKKENRKKMLWFVFLLLLVGGGAFYAGSFYSSSNRHNKQVVAQNGNTAPVPNTPVNPSASVSSPVNNTGEQLNNNNNISQQPATNRAEQNNITVPGKTGIFFNSRARSKTRVRIMPGVADGSSLENLSMEEPEIPGMNNPVKATTPAPVQTFSAAVPADEKTTAVEKEQQPIKAIENIKEATANKENLQKEKKKTKTGFLPQLALTFSAGPDISYVGDHKPGTTTFSYGAGLNYNISKRLSVATGFYVSRKIYSADSAYYKTPAGFFPANYKVNSIDANCKVYEIPITLSYHFAAGQKHSWYAAAGLSSLLMKSEIYNYDYKYGYYPTIFHKEYVVKNQNKHWLSVLTLSGGYEYQFNKAVSFTASPYIKLPLAGIGFGKVKLKSGGAIFTALVKPFARKK